VADGIVEVVACARDPGVRAKIAVRSYDPRIDPIGACVGMHGTRVQAVSNELAGERVDIVLYDANPAQFVLNALSPAKVASITMDEETHTMDVAVAEDQVSIAIGRGGQNVRLASELTGWTLNLMTEEQAAEKQEAEVGVLRQMFVDKLDLDESVADILVQEGFTSVEEVAFVPASELLAIQEFDEDLVQELRDRAQAVLLAQEISREEEFGDAEPAADLLEVEGMPRRVAYQLAAHGIVTREDLADQAVPDLLDIEGFDEALARQLIMAARAAWFTDDAAQA
jgi:N utilization substance protein A